MITSAVSTLIIWLYDLSLKAATAFWSYFPFRGLSVHMKTQYKIKPDMPPIPIYISWQTDAILMFIYKSRLTENIQIHGLLHSKQEILPWAISAHAQVGGWASLKLKSYNCPVSLTGEEVREHLTATLRQIFLYKSSFWLSKWEWKAWTDFSPTFLPQKCF